MGFRYRSGRPARRTWPAIVLATALLGAGVLAGASGAVTPAAASAASSPFGYACGANFTPGQARCLLIKDRTAHPAALTAQAAAIPSGNGYGPADLQAAYGLTSASAADGRGMTVAVVDAYNDPTAAADLANYRSAAGLPGLTAGQFTVYNQNGLTTPLPAEAPVNANGDWTEEESLDLDMVAAICPLCTIDLVEANDASAANMLVADGIAALALGARYISDSWGFTELAADTTLDSAIFSAPGVVYVAGTSEAGFGNVVYPAASPNVVSVGGTSLATSSSSRGWTESVWFTPAAGGSPAVGTGSGCSAFEPQPSWQASVSGIAAACHNRVENDVAANADPQTGVAVYDTSDGNTGWFEVGGTSEATPIIAATFALAGNDGNGGNKAAQSIYTNTSDLNTVTAGNNGTCAQAVLCTATGAASTYSGPAGWGTPDGITGFASIGNTITVTNPGSQAGTVGTATAGLQVSAADSAAGQALTYTATGLPAGLSISSSGLISGTPTKAGVSPVAVTATDPSGAAGSANFIWAVNPAGGASPSASCTPSATATTSATATATASASATATATTSPSATPSRTFPGFADCGGSETPIPLPSVGATLTPFSSPTPSTSVPASVSVPGGPAPSVSSSPTGAAPTPSAVAGSLPVTG